MPHSEEQFQQLADSIPQLAWMADVSGKVYWFNKRWFDYTGSTVEQVEGWGWKDLTHPDVTDDVVGKIQKCFESGTDWEDTFPLRNKDNDYRWFLSRAYPIRDSQGNILRWFGTNTDITERLEAEEALRESDAFNRSILESSPDCIKVLSEDGLLLSLNEGGRRALEIEDLSMCLNRPWVGFWPAESQGIAEAALEEVKQGRMASFSGFCPTSAGTPKWWEVVLTPMFDKSGQKLSKILCVSRDITPRKQIEHELHEALRQAQEAHAKALEANRRKDEFLANMSHELRTPMNAISGIGYILSKSRPLTEKQATCIKTLQSSSESLLALINDLLDLAKIESENIELENITFSLREIVEDVISMARVIANDKKISLVLDYGKALDEKYIGDPHRLKQILTNLTSNAVKFTERGGVKISVRQVSQQGGMVNVAVHFADTGIGIPAEKLETIFSKFSQGDTSISRKYGGTGLGLAISKTLADLMGGDISVKSTEGIGSEFTLHLPLARDHSLPMLAMPFAKSTLEPAGGHSAMVLIVEDYTANLLVACSYLELLGYRYDTARNGEEAVQKVQSGTRYDAILMDVQMPGMDGLSATRAIRNWETLHHLPNVPIIGVTAYALTGDREKCIDAGMSDYLSKPFTPDTIQQKLSAMLERRPQAMLRHYS